MNNPAYLITTGRPLSYQNLVIACIVILGLHFGRILFIPLFYGLFIAIVLYPSCKRLEKSGMPRSLAILTCLLVIASLMAILVLILVLQVQAFSSDLPKLQQMVVASFQNLQLDIYERFGLPITKQVVWLQNLSTDLPKHIASFLQQTLTATISTGFILLLVPVFTALFLYNRGTFVHFVRLVAVKMHRDELNKILDTTIHTYYRYIKGMLMVYLIVGVLNSVGLLALGVKHAILFGILTAIMTIVPYVGIIVSALLPISIAWITTESIWTPIGVMVVFSVVQYLEANIIFPFVVGAELNVNTWSTLVAVIAGGVLWGISGMILFVPVVAILKIISDNVSSMAAINVLLSRTGTRKFK